MARGCRYTYRYVFGVIHRSHNPFGVGTYRDRDPKVAEYSNLGLRDAIPLGLPPKCPNSRLLRVLRFVELNRESARNLEVSHEAVAVIFDLLSELDSAFPKSPHGLVNVVAIKRNIRSARSRIIAISWVQAYIGFGSIEDQPTVSDIDCD